MEPAWAYLLTGLLCGVLSATFGVGSGLILVPILVLAFGFSQQTAQGTSLAVMVPMSLVGALSYRFLAGVPLEFGSTLYLSIGAVAGAIAGSRIPMWFSVPMAQRLFAVLLILIAARMLTAPAGTVGPVPDSPGGETRHGSGEGSSI